MPRRKHGEPKRIAARRTPTSEKSRQEASEASVVLKDEGYIFDLAFTSVLKRAIRTLSTVLDESELV